MRICEEKGIYIIVFLNFDLLIFKFFYFVNCLILFLINLFKFKGLIVKGIGMIFKLLFLSCCRCFEGLYEGRLLGRGGIVNDR